jgi:DNA-binding NarL/FixJ family response regulator
MLTVRQHQVASLVCEGLSNKMIARKLGLSEGTVKVHLHAIFERLDVRSRHDLFIRFGRFAASHPFERLGDVRRNPGRVTLAKFAKI